MQLKLKIYSLIKLYYKIVRNHTGIQIRSFKSVFFLLVLGILSFFFREEVLNNISDNTKLQYLLLIACIFNILFIKVNLGFRLIITVMKGIPFYIKQIKSNKQKKIHFFSFLVYNSILIILSIMILLILYFVLSVCYSEIYKLVFIYNFIVSFTVCGLYLEESYCKIRFSMEEVDTNKLSLLQKLFLLTLPAIVFLNIASYINSATQFLIYFKDSHTIYCEPTDGTPDSNVQSNVQANFQTNTQQNIQGYMQPAPNINSQHNTQINQQATTIHNPGNRDNTPFVEKNILKRYTNSNFGNSTKNLDYKLKTDSFWDNITHLRDLKTQKFLNTDYINHRIDLVVAKARAESAFNAFLLSNNYQPIWKYTHLIDKLYGFPILFNGYYDFYDCVNEDSFRQLAREGKIENILQLYYFIKYEVALPSSIRTGLLKNTELLIEEGSGRSVSITENNNVFDQVYTLVSDYLAKKNLMFRNFANVAETREPIIIENVFGFKIIVSQYNEEVGGYSLPIKKFVVCDSHSQLLARVKNSKIDWLNQWSRFSLDPNTHTLINNDFFIYDNTSVSGNNIVGLKFSVKLADRILEVLNTNTGRAGLVTNENLFHPVELEIYKRKAVTLFGNRYNIAKLEESVNLFIERNN